MNPSRLAVVAIVAVACVAEPEVTQPLQFNHERHIKADMECISCHERVEDHPVATLPTIDKCMECHEEKKGDSPDEPKVREYAARDEEIPWIRVNHLPGHVYFSHAAHVTLGKLECHDCHGKVEAQTAAFVRPNVELSMKDCMECHDSRGASNSCLVCHD